MKSTIVLIGLCLLLASCATPTTTMQHPKTKQVVTCGGGMVGYSIQQDNDADCVKNYQDAGFKVLQTKTSSMK